MPPPPPKKSKTGLVIGIVVAALAVIAAVVLAIVLVAGSDDDSNDDSATDDETSASSEPDESETPDASETPEPTPEPAGEILQGTGYSYVLPDSWKDITASIGGQDAAGTIDTASAPGESLETTFANVIIESGPANGQTDLDAARDQVAQNLAASTGVTPEEIDSPTVDGVATVGLQLTQSNAAGVSVLQDAYVTILADTYYVIGFSRDSTKPQFEGDFQAILDSWTWE
jgi:hypothetical protein